MQKISDNGDQTKESWIKIKIYDEDEMMQDEILLIEIDSINWCGTEYSLLVEGFTIIHHLLSLFFRNEGKNSRKLFEF